MKPQYKLIAAGLLAFAASTAANANTVQLTGAGFTLSYDSAQVGLFGTPILAGSSLVFTPPSFRAASIVPGFSPNVYSSFNFQVKADVGYSLTGVSFGASGGYMVSGGGSQAGLFGVVGITSLDAATPGVSQSEWFSRGVKTNSKPKVGEWSVSTALDQLDSQWSNLRIEALLYSDAPGSDSRGAAGAKFAFVDLDSATLGLTVSQSGGGVVAPVPEPEAYMMLLAGLGLVGAVARRRTGSK